MNPSIAAYLKNLYLPEKNSHKGKNGRLLVIGGSHLFHAASLWASNIASRIVDLVHYSSVEENNKIVQKLKMEFRDGIVVPRNEVESYIDEDDCVLIGPGMLRTENSKLKTQISKPQLKSQSLREINQIKDEGVQTYYLTKYLLLKYPHKKWVIDAGALQMMEPEWIPEGAILTPHRREFEGLYLKSQMSQPKADPPRAENLKAITSRLSGINDAVNAHSSQTTSGQNLKLEERVKFMAKKYNCTILLKGERDIVVSKDKSEVVEGGNAGMTKGGTGDVLAGLTAALYCKNEAFTAAVSASYINKKAGSELYEKMGYWFNASDLADQIPQTMRKLLIK